MRLTRWSRRWPRSKDNLVSLVGLVILVTICIVCTLQNFQFCLAHFWTDFQSCFIIDVRKNLLLQDLFISGDVDEVMSRKALHQLKWCQVKEDVITGDSLSNVTPFNQKTFERRPVDAPWEPWPSSSNGLPCPWKTSHLQSPNHLQGDPLPFQ